MGFGGGEETENLTAGSVEKCGGYAVVDGGFSTELERHGAGLRDPLWSAKCPLASRRRRGLKTMENGGRNGNCSKSKESRARFPPKRGRVKKEIGKLITDGAIAAMSMAAQLVLRMIDSCTGNPANAPSPSSEEDNSKP